jgi:hypothetical protein
MPFCHGSRVRHDLLNVEPRECLIHCSAAHSIAIPDQVARGIPIRDRLNHLLGDPFRCGVLGDVGVQNFPPAVSENSKNERTLRLGAC